jgi:Kef-type K+ transport system membrane component KefB
MSLLLFIIGFSLDFRKMARLRNYVLLGTIIIIACEGLFGSLLLYFVFPAEVSHSYLVALVTAVSFATVGEVVLLPILNEFGVIKTTFGQLTLGIGTLDDIIEVLMLAVVAVLPAFLPVAQTQSFQDPLSILLGLQTFGGLFGPLWVIPLHSAFYKNSEKKTSENVMNREFYFYSGKIVTFVGLIVLTFFFPARVTMTIGLIFCGIIIMFLNYFFRHVISKTVRRKHT